MEAVIDGHGDFMHEAREIATGDQGVGALGWVRFAISRAVAVIDRELTQPINFTQTNIGFVLSFCWGRHPPKTGRIIGIFYPD